MYDAERRASLAAFAGLLVHAAIPFGGCYDPSLRPVVCAPRRFCALAVLSLSATFFLFLPRPAAAAWSVTYQHSGGITGTAGGNHLWGDPTLNGGWNPNGPNAYTNVYPVSPLAGGTAMSAGTLTAVFTWTGSAPAPATLQFLMFSEAYTTSGTPTPTADNGLGDAPTVDASGNLHSQGYHVESQPTGGSSVVSFPVKVTTSNAQGMEFFGVGIAAYPITTNLTNTTPDSSGNLNILVGQGCTASVVGIPSALLNNTAHPPTYSWSVSGTTFQDWEPTTPQIGTTPANPQASYYDAGPGTVTNPTYHWFWNDPTTTSETVTCAVNLTPPAGQGAAFSITATQNIKVYVPTRPKNVSNFGDGRVIN